MTSFDRVLTALAERIDSLPRRSIAALFLACAQALRPGFRRWASHRGRSTEVLLERALASARSFALTGDPSADVHDLLASLEVATPEGDSPDEVSSTPAQDSWICADIAIRVIADPQYAAGSGIEYALEPIVQHATERVHGVSQLGSGPDENDQMDKVLRQPDVVEALAFCSWAVDFLNGGDALTDAGIVELTNRAAALAP